MKRLLPLLALLALSGREAAAQSSSGNYRVPYRNGIDATVLEDASTHALSGRVDLRGVDTSTNTYWITAAADGTVRAIRDSGGVGCGNCTNYVWIQHANGEWTGYFHLRTGSASTNAGLSVGDPVVAGQNIGIEGSVGSPSGNRLRFEVGVPTNPNAPVAPLSGMLIGTTRVPVICNITDNIFRKGVRYTPANCGAQEISAGIYRLPYSNAVMVSFGFDHLTHTPVKTRLDLNGVGGPNGTVYPVVAAASGTVMWIVDTNTITCTASNSCSDFNNYVWIRHSNGEWTKYTHFLPNSVRGKAGLTNGQFVTAGTYLGDEGAIGFAFGVHCHFEVAVPTDGHLYTNAFQPNLINAFDVKGGFINGVNRVPLFCNVPGNIGYAGDIFAASPCTGGACVDDIVVPNRFIRGTDAYVAGDTVDTGGNGVSVDTYGSLALYAGSKVTLRPGFRASFNSYLRAAVRPCVNTP